MTPALRSRLVLAPAVALLSLTLGACDVVLSGFKEEASDTFAKTYPMAANGRVEVVNINGPVTLEAADVSQVEVHAQRIARASTPEAAKALLQRVEIVDEATPDRVRLETRKQAGSGIQTGGIEVRYRLRVPSGVQVDLQTTNGPLTVEGITRGAKLTTTNGPVTGKRLAGTVRAVTTNGSVELELTSVTEPVTAETTNGPVTVEIPKNASVTFSAECSNGVVNVSGLELQEDGDRRRCRAAGRINGGGTRIELATTNGPIALNGH